MSRQIIITLPEWTEIKGINHIEFADLLPAYDEMLYLIKDGTPLDKVLEDIKADTLDKIRAEIRNEQNMDYKCHRKTYDNCLRIIDKYKTEPLVKESRTLVKDLVKKSEDKDVRIVINISEESYKNIKEQVDKRDYPDMQIGRAIADGVLIPECHVAESEDKDE